VETRAAQAVEAVHIIPLLVVELLVKVTAAALETVQVLVAVVQVRRELLELILVLVEVLVAQEAHHQLLVLP
jgi:hypothetical protein